MDCKLLGRQSLHFKNSLIIYEDKTKEIYVSFVPLYVIKLRWLFLINY